MSYYKQKKKKKKKKKRLKKFSLKIKKYFKIFIWGV
jgi:hypothetical protein